MTSLQASIFILWVYCARCVQDLSLGISRTTQLQSQRVVSASSLPTCTNTLPPLHYPPPPVPSNISVPGRSNSVWPGPQWSWLGLPLTMTAILELLLLLPPLLLLCLPGGEAQRPAAAVRQYFIAAVEIGWDYIYLDDDDPTSDQRWTLRTNI